MRARILLATTLISALAYACSGVDPNGDLISGDAGGDDDASSSHRDAGVRDSGIHDASISDGGIVDSGHDGGSGFDAGHDGGVITHPHHDGGVIPATCGTDPDASIVTCDGESPTCCGTQGDGLTTQTSFACTTSPATCTGTSTVAVQCRDDLDCPSNKVCCGTLDALVNVYDSVQCADSCPQTDDAGSFTNFLRFCTPGVTDSECTDPGASCVPSGILIGFNHC
ncbi:MAG: hypothetical protein ABI183_21870 [Polyangiaceae bacterium]